MKPDRATPSLLDRVLEEMARRIAEPAPYVPPSVERWNAKVIPLPTPKWPVDRQRAVAEQAMQLALKAQREVR